MRREGFVEVTGWLSLSVTFRQYLNMSVKKPMYLHIIAPNMPSLADSGNIVLNTELNSDEFFFYREVPSAMYRTKRSPVHRRIVERWAILFSIVCLLIILFQDIVNRHIYLLIQLPIYLLTLNFSRNFDGFTEFYRNFDGISKYRSRTSRSSSTSLGFNETSHEGLC